MRQINLSMEMERKLLNRLRDVEVMICEFASQDRPVYPRRERPRRCLWIADFLWHHDTTCRGGCDWDKYAEKMRRQACATTRQRYHAHASRSNKLFPPYESE
jgi:hypothetical protein